MDKRVFCSTDWYIWYSFVLTTLNIPFTLHHLFVPWEVQRKTK